MQPSDSILFSGGAPGAEAEFGACAERHGIEEVNFTFDGHRIDRRRGVRVLNHEELQNGDVSLEYVGKLMQRRYADAPTIRKVLQTLWYQVNSGQEIYVIGTILNDNTVRGGTGWGAEFAKLCNKPLFVYDQEKRGWSQWTGEKWNPLTAPTAPAITHPHFTGTGTRTLQDHSKKAIEDLFTPILSLMSDATDKLDALISEVVDLRHTAALLNWDERVCMPPGGVPAHGEMLATVRRLAHEKFTSDEVGRLIELARAEVDGLSPDSDLHKKVAVTARDYDKATRVPGAYVAEHARVASAAHQAWREAREQASFPIFEPHLARVIELKRQYVDFFKPEGHAYDALLDDFEPGALTSEVQGIFDALRPRQVELLRAIAHQPTIDDRFLRVPYAEPDILAFALEVASSFGFDWTRGRQDKSAHPFATSMGSDDVRITTRFDQRHPFEMLFSTIHETGHGLYEQGISPVWSRTVLRGGASLGVHESQSRLWENIVGRSRPFWEHFYPALQQRFPSQLSGVTLDQFYRGINKVQPSLIRVEADEVTYNLHVMLRVEMEIAMLNGDVKPADAPDLWNAKMQEYLGVVPAEAAHGILQDMHWSVGLFGYFATYTIGNLISVQLWDTFRAQEPDCDEQLRQGEFSRLRLWLQEQIHRHGRSYQPRDIVQRVTRSRIDPAQYLAYLDWKYRDVYAL